MAEARRRDWLARDPSQGPAGDATAQQTAQRGGSSALGAAQHLMVWVRLCMYRKIGSTRRWSDSTKLGDEGPSKTIIQLRDTHTPFLLPSI